MGLVWLRGKVFGPCLMGLFVAAASAAGRAEAPDDLAALNKKVEVLYS